MISFQDNGGASIDTAIAYEISKVWDIAKNGGFNNYFISIYNHPCNVTVNWKRILIFQLNDANFGLLAFDLQIVARSWIIDDLGFAATNSPAIPGEDREQILQVPIIRFCRKKNELLIGENYGNGLLFWRLHSIALENSQITLNAPLKVRLA